MKREKALRQLDEQRDRLLEAAKDSERIRLINKIYWRYKDNMMACLHTIFGTPKSGSPEWLFKENADKFKEIKEEPIYKWMYM